MNRVFAFGSLFVGFALAATSCRSPTEIVLKIHTDAPCTDADQWQGVAVYVGEPGVPLEKNAPTLTTSHCDASGYVGSLVVTPSGDKDARVGVRVVAGLTRNPEACEEAAYAGCIVARRALRFTPHDALELDVELLTDCTSRGCDPDHTCVLGRCVASDFVEAPAESSSVPDGEPSVRCGDDGLRCATTGNVCCLTVDVTGAKTHGRCMPSSECESIVLNCDDATDCASLADDDPDSVACFLQYEYDLEKAATIKSASFEPLAVSLSQCLPVSGQLGTPRLTLCQDKRPCKNMYACGPSHGGDQTPNQLPGYLWCEYY